MGREIERKFLVQGDAWRQVEGTLYCQGYLCRVKERTVRVRLAGDTAQITVKGPSSGCSRAEYEYEIPLSDAREMLDTLCEKPLIEKRRHKIHHQGLTWEVDEFHGANAGLIVAEVELESEEQQFTPPSWVGREVSGDLRYYNANLVTHPYCEW